MKGNRWIRWLLLDACHQAFDILEVGLRCSNQQAVGARVGHHQWTCALGHGLRHVRVPTVHDLIDGGGHAIKVAALHWQYVQGRNIGSLQGVELGNNSLDDIKRIGATGYQQRIGLFVSQYGHFLQVSGAWFRGTHAFKARVHELLNEWSQARGAGVRQLHQFEFAQISGDFAVELL